MNRSFKILAGASLALTALSAANLNAEGFRTYKNVPTLTVSSASFSITDGREVLEKSLENCRQALLDAQRLLVRKSVDIVLESTECTLIHSSNETARFEASVFFLN